MRSPLGCSVIIPCHNAGRFVLESVTSVLEHGGGIDVEIIVVNDGSSERETLEALDQASGITAVKVLHLSENRGVQFSRNHGIRHSSFPFVTVLDADDRLQVPPNHASVAYLERAIAVLDEDVGIAFVHTGSQMFGAFSGLTISSYPVTEDMVVRKHHVPTSIVYRREDVRLGATYDARVEKWQDWTFGTCLLATRWQNKLENRIRYLPGPFHGYRIHSRGHRLSMGGVSERDMVFLTVERHLDYFRFHHGAHLSADEICKIVTNSKPSRLQDLVQMAAYDVDQALRVIDERQFALESPFSELGIP